MKCHAREGGAFRISLTYGALHRAGKTSARTGTYHGLCVKLVPDEKVVEGVEFETEDPALCGERAITLAPSGVEGGTNGHRHPAFKSPQ